jgi:hypothetical protein
MGGEFRVYGPLSIRLVEVHGLLLFLVVFYLKLKNYYMPSFSGLFKHWICFSSFFLGERSSQMLTSFFWCCVGAFVFNQQLLT